jgi:dihydroorotase
MNAYELPGPGGATIQAMTSATSTPAPTLTPVLTITRPDDWHLHVRDGEALHTVVPHAAAQFGRAIIMPNLRPPVTTAAQAVAYRERIQAAVPAGVRFEPLMTLYLTDNLPADEIARAKDAGVVAAKLYPAGATTNSDAGVTDLRKTYKTLEAMQKAGLLLLVHGEVTSSDIDLFDREAVFIDTQLIPLRRDFPELKIVFEHITTKEAAHYVRDAGRFTGATVTAHHLLYNRNAIFTGGIRPHYYCLPVLKRETHRLALVEAATSGDARFFLGTDSAPHPAHLKEHATGCAGCYTSHAAMELYAEAFDAAGALDKLEAFASFNGADFYGLPRNTGSITLKKESWRPPEKLEAHMPSAIAELKPLALGRRKPALEAKIPLSLS